ncbi:MAG: helix-turn-helix domain-containing protein [Candidatus Limnocylindria bacterium]
MNVERIGLIVRILRVRQRLTQATLATRAGVKRRAVSRVELGRARELPLRTVEAICNTLGARVDLRIQWNGPELDRLLDAAHAALGASVKRRLERWGWVVRVEVSYSHYGERGRIDLLAWHPATGILVVIELKTALVDIQALLGSLDVKVRLARNVAERYGWEVRGVVPAIVFAEDRAVRKRLVQFETLFDRFSVRGRSAISWMRKPGEVPTGLLWFASPLAKRAPSGSGRRVYGPRRAA